MAAEKIKSPWRRVGHRQIMDAEGAVVCEVWSSVGIQEANANEDLIASAPNLLAALRCARISIAEDRDSLAKSHTSPDGEMDALGQNALDAYDATLSQIDVAIIKATGAVA